MRTYKLFKFKPTIKLETIPFCNRLSMFLVVTSTFATLMMLAPKGHECSMPIETYQQQQPTILVLSNVITKLSLTKSLQKRSNKRVKQLSFCRNYYKLWKKMYRCSWFELGSLVLGWVDLSKYYNDIPSWNIYWWKEDAWRMYANESGSL